MREQWYANALITHSTIVLRQQQLCYYHHRNSLLILYSAHIHSFSLQTFNCQHLRAMQLKDRRRNQIASLQIKVLPSLPTPVAQLNIQRHAFIHSHFYSFEFDYLYNIIQWEQFALIYLNTRWYRGQWTVNWSRRILLSKISLLQAQGESVVD